MDYRTFIEMMKEQVQKHLGKDYEVQITTNTKLNGTEKTGLSISRTQEPQQVVPVIYLEECFERYLQEGKFTKYVEEICVVYKHQEENEEKIMAELESIENMNIWEKVQNKVYPMIVSAKENEDLKEKYFYHEYLDLLILYVIRVTEVGIGSIKITKQMVKSWKVSEYEIHRQAVENLKTDGYWVKSLYSVVKENLLGIIEDDEEEIEGAEPMYVLTNQIKYFGAAGIFLCAELFQEIVGKRNFYILPSSIHELILVVDHEEYEMEVLSAMVRKVNEEQLTADEILSDHAYYFDWKTKQIYTDKKRALDLPTANLTLKQVCCQNCISFTEGEEIWHCDEMQKPVEEIECCPEGVGMPERNM